MCNLEYGLNNPDSTRKHRLTQCGPIVIVDNNRYVTAHLKCLMDPNSVMSEM